MLHLVEGSTKKKGYVKRHNKDDRNTADEPIYAMQYPISTPCNHTNMAAPPETRVMALALVRSEKGSLGAYDQLSIR